MANYVGATYSPFREQQRQLQQELGQLPDVNSAIKNVYGMIVEVDSNRPLIKARTEDGQAIANGNWIPLNYSVEEIVERFGTIRKGMNVSVQCAGPTGNNASATIIGMEGERIAEGTLIENKVQKSLFAIFTPGV